MSAIREVFGLFLPGPDASEAALVQWRTIIAVTLFFVTLSIFCLYIITARASEVDDLRIAVYVPAMEQMHRRFCLSKNDETRVLLHRQITKLQVEYRRITGDRYPLIPCHEIIERDQRDRSN